MTDANNSIDMSRAYIYGLAVSLCIAKQLKVPLQDIHADIDAVWNDDGSTPEHPRSDGSYGYPSAIGLSDQTLPDKDKS